MLKTTRNALGILAGNSTTIYMSFFNNMITLGKKQHHMTNDTENIAYPIPASFIQVAVAALVLLSEFSGQGQFTCRKDNA
jgi:hypothetical protein